MGTQSALSNNETIEFLQTTIRAIVPLSKN